MDNLIFLIIAVNAIISYQGFNNPAFLSNYIFHEGKILYGKEYVRMLSSGFLHANWGHLLFNMMTLYFFGGTLIMFLGPINFVIIYFLSLIGGNLLSLYLKREDPHYSALGASGAVSGILYAFIIPFPLDKIYIFFIPIGIPAWLFGLLFIAYSIFGISKNIDNIGHEAHLGGAITGLIIFLIIRPAYIFEEYLIVLGMLIPTLLFLITIIKRPDLFKSP